MHDIDCFPLHLAELNFDGQVALTRNDGFVLHDHGRQKKTQWVFFIGRQFLVFYAESHGGTHGAL